MNRLGLKLGAAIVFFIAAVALLAPWISPHRLGAFDLSQRLLGVSFQHPFGLDEEGRDLLTLVLWGARISLLVSVAVVSLSSLIGTIIGLVSGYFGKWWDHGFVFVTDVILAFPSILLVIALAAFQREGGVGSIIIVLAAVGWVSYARIVRAQVLSLKERDYVQAARANGASVVRIWVHHLIPNLMAPLLVQATFSMAGVILAESTLTFLGLGLPPNIPSWGRLIDQGVQYLLVAPHLSLFPGLAIALLILGFNFLGDGLRDYWDVKEVKSAKHR